MDKTTVQKLLHALPQSTAVRQLIAALEMYHHSVLSPLFLLIGLFSAGKSLLAQALTDDLSGKQFPSGIGPTTHHFNIVDRGIYRLGDTPGFDAIRHDTAEAKGAIQKSDSYFLVHAATRGGLIRYEVDLLQELKQGGLLTPDNIVIVVTHKDARETELPEIQQEILDQLRTALGFVPPMFNVSSSDYIKAVRMKDTDICEMSGIPQLRSFIEERATVHRRSLERQRQERVLFSYTEVRKELVAQQELVASRLSQLCQFDSKQQLEMGRAIRAMADSANKLLDG